MVFLRLMNYYLSVKKLGVVKGPQPLKLIPALTTCASKRMKTHRFSYFADFAAGGANARGKTREKLEKGSARKQSPLYAVVMINEVSIISLRTAARGVLP